jgi:hypothetical protein
LTVGQTITIIRPASEKFFINTSNKHWLAGILQTERAAQGVSLTITKFDNLPR